MMKSKLSDLCSFADGRVAVADLDLDNYISTENMLPNKEGITNSAGLPLASQTQAYQSGDVLVSNIRPYFRKIWIADRDGGCSNDVLVLRAKEGCNPTFLYYLLSDDSFFDYATATAKGTKMPRGDKGAIMRYEVPDVPLDVQGNIAQMLVCLDDKIANNKKLNHHLEQMAQAIFKSWFVDFEPWGGEQPDDWKDGRFSDIASITSGKRPPFRQAMTSSEFDIPLIGASSIMGFTNAVLYDEKILIAGRVGTHGVIQRYSRPCWASDNTLVIKSDYYEFAYQHLCGIDFHNMNRGSTQPLITQTDLKNVPIILPDQDTLIKFEKLVGSLMKMFDGSVLENERLANLRDTLLPRLMSGELSVTDLGGVKK
jgi:type I restriction enzyme, S subunit